MSWLDGVRRILPQRRTPPTADQRLTPSERAALELAGYDDIAKRSRAAAAGPAGVVDPGCIDSTQGYSIRGGSE